MTRHSPHPRLEDLRRKAGRRNYLCNLADGALALLAFNLISQDFVVPAFLKKAGASDSLIGLILSAPPLLTFMLPVLVAGYLNALKLKKPFILVICIFMRVHYLATVIAALLLLPDHPGAFLVTFTCTLIVHSASFSLIMPAWADLFAKVTPLRQRGTLFARRWSLAILPIILFGWAVHRVLDRYAFPVNYAILFAAAWVILMPSILFVWLIRERKGKTAPAGAARRSFIRGVPALLRRDRNFTWFLASRLPSQLAFGMVSAFFVLTAAGRFHVAPESVLAQYLVIGYGSTLVGCIVFGRLGDRRGHRSNLLLEVPLVLCACVVALLARDPLEFGIVFVLAGTARGIMAVSGLSVVLEFGGEDERPGYIAVYNTIFMPLFLAGPAAGGFLRDYVGVTKSFFAAMALALVGFAILVFRVKEPRRRGVGAG